MTHDEIQAAIFDAIEDSLEHFDAGSDERIGFVFVKSLANIFGVDEACRLWEKICGLSFTEMALRANDIQRQQFKNRWGISIDTACEMSKPKTQLRPVK